MIFTLAPPHSVLIYYGHVLLDNWILDGEVEMDDADMEVKIRALAFGADGAHLILEDRDQRWYHVISTAGARLGESLDLAGLQRVRGEMDKDPAIDFLLRFSSSEFRRLGDLATLIGKPSEGFDMDKMFALGQMPESLQKPNQSDCACS
jgi:hypothetical protein